VRAAAVLGFAALLLAGCATPPPKSDPDALADYKANNDPLEPTNRVFYAINDGLLTYVLTPVARGYNFILPQPARTGIHNVLNNMGSPVQFANDVMEAKSRRAGDTFMRFLINSTAGVGGLFDVAKHVGYKDHSAVGGTTLALWGVPDGPYLYLPFFGPSSVRDGLGLGMDTLLNPYYWTDFNGQAHLSVISTALAAVDGVAPHIDDLKKLNQDSLDPYATQRSLNRQLRANAIKAAEDDNRATVPDWYPTPAPAPQAPPPDTGNSGHPQIATPTVSPVISGSGPTAP